MKPHTLICADARITYHGALGVVLETPQPGEDVLVRLENDDNLRRVKSRDLIPLQDIRTTDAGTPLQLISQDKWDKAERLATMCRMIACNADRGTAVTFAARQLGVCEKTIRRAWKRFLKDPRTSALLDKKPGRKEGSRYLTNGVDPIIDECLKEIYFVEEKPDLSLAIEEIEKRCFQVSLSPPADSTIYRRAHGINQSYATRKRHGHKKYCDKYRPVPGNLSATQPLQTVEIDHTLADVILVSDDEHRIPIGRPWVTFAICVVTRMIVGVYVSLDAPSSVSLAMCILFMMMPKEQIVNYLGFAIETDWPCEGSSEELLLDNAQEMHALAIQSGCAEYGMTLRYRPVATPHWGGHIERLIGTQMRRLRLLPGATQRDVRDREDKKVEAKACLTLNEFRQWLITEITTQYHQHVHRAIDMTPLQKWKEMAGQHVPAKPWTDEEMLRCFVHFLPFEEHPVRRIGIEHSGLFYWNDDLIPYVSDGHIYHIRFDPRDVRRVYFVTPKGEVIVVPCTTDQPASSFAEFRSRRAEARKNGEDGVDRLARALGSDQNRLLVSACRKKQKHAHRSASKAKERANDANVASKCVPESPRQSTLDETDQVFVPRPFPAMRIDI